MRKLLISLLAVAAMGTGATFAQSGQWAGVSTGYPLGLTIHYGLADLVGPGIDLRTNLSGSFTSTQGVSVLGVALGADVLWNFGGLALDQPVFPYAGGGLVLVLVGGSAGGAVAGGFGIGIQGVGGAEYRIPNSQFGVFGELNAGALYGSVGGVSGILPTLGLRLGGNYHF